MWNGFLLLSQFSRLNMISLFVYTYQSSHYQIHERSNTWCYHEVTNDGAKIKIYQQIISTFKNQHIIYICLSILLFSLHNIFLLVIFRVYQDS